MHTPALTRQRVYDPVLRLIHAWNALMVVLLLVSSQLAALLQHDWPVPALWRLHLWCGYLLFLGLTARLTWGLAGPRHARLTELWQPAAWLEALRERRFFVPPRRFGHHPPATLGYVGFYALAWLMVITGLGLAAIDQGVGPLYFVLGYDFLRTDWFRRPHDWLEELILAYVLLHLAALVLHERWHGVPMAQAMVSGYQYLQSERKDNDGQSNPT
ncbi:MAG: cytochrome b/b6 domain-containing protein [Burkholderiales bacterium]|nr:cytochrome b/b6 domain-containing protein [Burkholderiales bacterium]